jgi:carbonic anhydrase
MKPNSAKSILLAFAFTFTGLAATAAVHADAGDAALTREAQAAITPAIALQMLKQGNERFVSGESTERNFLAQVKQTSSGQFPFAAVLREMIDKGEIGLVGAMYDVSTGKVLFYE